MASDHITETLARIDLEAITGSLDALHPDSGADENTRKVAYMRMLQRLGCLPAMAFPRLQELCNQKAKDALNALKAKRN